MSTIIFVFLYALACLANSQRADLRMMMTMAKFDKAKPQALDAEILDALHSIGDLNSMIPNAALNLTDQCAEDIRFFRDSRAKFFEESEALDQCVPNDSICKKTHTNSKQSVAWTIQQMDAFGKIPAGITHLNMYWYGSYAQCIDIDIMKPNSSHNSHYQGKYCYAMMSLKSVLSSFTECPADADDYTGYTANIHWAICIPNSCSQKDAMALIQQYDKLKAMACNVFCIDREITFTNSAIAMITVFSFIGFIVVGATIVDYALIHGCSEDSDAKNQKHVLLRVYLCFSLYTNGQKILDMTKRSGQLECLHGIRVMSMLWVILGHTYLHIQYVDNLVDAYKLTKDWTVEVINNATFSVDTFFTMSGFLVAYLWLKEQEKQGMSFVKSKNTWLVYYIHRYVRLTPVLMLILAMNGTLIPYFMRGPHEYDLTANTGRTCAETWWTNLLYVNNVVKPLDQCYGPAWYLPNDMQFYALSPIILILLVYSPISAFALSFALILASMGGTAATIAIRRFPPMTMAGGPIDESVTDIAAYTQDFMRLVYMAPWTRFPTYLIGLLFGYLYQRRLCKLKMNKTMALASWCIAFAVALSVVYGLSNYASGHQMDIGLRAFYGALSRPAWSFCICWLMYACLSGRGGPINELLSWRGWLPLSRLSYCMYLLHYTIIEVVMASNDFPLHWDTHLNWISKWISIVVITLFASFFVSCALEAPIIGLERMILHSNTDKIHAIQENRIEKTAL